jgi:hypothetical protein
LLPMLAMCHDIFDYCIGFTAACEIGNHAEGATCNQLIINITAKVLKPIVR